MKTLIIFALIYIPIITSTNTDFAKITKVGNVYLHYQKAYGRLEINKRVEIFQVLADKLIETKFKTNTKLFFYFYNNYENEDAKFIHVGFGKFQGFYFENRKIYTQGIKIVVRDIDFDIKKMLQLVYNTYSNIEIIKTNQAQVIYNTYNSLTDSFKSINTNLLHNYMEAKEAYIDTLLNNKTYRNEYYNPTETSLNYFYKNNTFSIFNNTIFHYNETPILVLDSIYEIIGNSNEGFFVFTNPNTFYYIAANFYCIKGPHKIENLSNNRQPIYNIRIAHPIEKNYQFKINNDFNAKEIIYNPNLNIVQSYTIVNYIDTIKKAKKNRYITNAINNNKPIGLKVSLIVLTIYILILLAKKNKKNLAF